MTSLLLFLAQDIGKEYKLKLISYKTNSKIDNTQEILSSSPLGEKIMGESVGTIFTFGFHQIEILNIE